MKTIKLRDASTKKVIYQFNVSDTQLKLAKRLGVSKEQFITELSKELLKDHLKDDKNEV
jgi:hypothetical protein